jgi:hypothetical protein
MGWWRRRYRRLGIGEGFSKGVVGLLLFGAMAALWQMRPSAMVEMVAMAMIFERRE